MISLLGRGGVESSPRGTSGESSKFLLPCRVQGEQDSSSGSEGLGSVDSAVGSFEDGGGDGDGDGDGEGDGGVGVGAGAGEGFIGSGSGCTGKSIGGGSAGRTFEEPDDAARRRRSQTIASSVVRRQLSTALLVAAAASLVPILETSDVVFLALPLLVLPEQKIRPYSMLKGSLTISSLKYFTVATPSSTAVYATLKPTSRGLRTSVQPMERVWRVSRRAGMRLLKSSLGSVLAIGNERHCLGRMVSGRCRKAWRRSVS